MRELLRPAGDQMFDTRAWRGPAVVGGDGIEPPTSTELAEHDPSRRRLLVLARRRPLAVAQYAALSFRAPPRTFTIVDIDFVAISTATSLCHPVTTNAGAWVVTGSILTQSCIRC